MTEPDEQARHFDPVEALAHYGLGEVRAVRPVRPDGVYRVDTANGSVCVHLHRPTIDRARLEAMHQIMSAVSGSGIVCPVPLPSADGTSVFRWESRVGDVTRWIEHDAVSIHQSGRGPELLIRSAGLLARLHDVMATLDVAIRSTESYWRPTESLPDLLAAAHWALAAEATATRRSAELSSIMAQALEAVRLIGNRLDPDRVDFQLTHGEFGGLNVLCRADEVVGVVDFDRSEYRPRLYDLMWLIYFLFHREELTEEHWTLARRCCQAYSAATKWPVTSTEWASLPLLFAHLSASGIAAAPTEAQPLAETEAFGQLLPLTLQLIEEGLAGVARLTGSDALA